MIDRPTGPRPVGFDIAQRVCCLGVWGRTKISCVVKHPSEWSFPGYSAIIEPPQRYRLIDPEELMISLGLDKSSYLSGPYQKWIDAALQNANAREKKWSESIAVGNIEFVNRFRKSSGRSVNGRKIIDSGETAELREHESPYSAVFEAENAALSSENTFLWDTFVRISI